MIPDINQIIDGLLSGQYSREQALALLDEHLKLASESDDLLRDHFAANVDTSGVALSAFEALIGDFPAYADAKQKQDWYARGEAAYRYHRADAMLKARAA